MVTSLAVPGRRRTPAKTDPGALVTRYHAASTRFARPATTQEDPPGYGGAGKPFAVSIIDVNRIAGGQLAERWASQDDLGMLQQLGVIPPPGQTGV